MYKVGGIMMQMRRDQGRRNVLWDGVGGGGGGGSSHLYFQRIQFVKNTSFSAKKWNGYLKNTTFLGEKWRGYFNNTKLSTKSGG